jgi:Restriction endonuclease
MTPKTIADRLENVMGVEGTPRRLISAIEAELCGHFGEFPLRAAEIAERTAPSVARVIAERAAESEEAGIISTLVLLGTTSDSVAGCCHVLPTDIPAVVAAKQQRVHAGSLLTEIRALTFDDFEKFGARVLAEIGASFTQVTPRVGDQGIDFYGRLSLGQYQGGLAPPFIKLSHDVVLLFAGQAKHYPTASVGPEVVRELIGAVSLARTKTFSRTNVDIFPGFDLKPFSPLVTLLFTTGKFTNGAAQLAEAAGIIARSGEQLAVFLADKGVAMRDEGAGTIFDPSKFREWLNSK